MLLPEYRNSGKLCQTIRPIEPYGRLLGATVYEPPVFHFDPDPLYRETVFKQGWDPEKDIPPSVKEYSKIQKQSVDWLKKQRKS